MRLNPCRMVGYTRLPYLTADAKSHRAGDDPPFEPQRLAGDLLPPLLAAAAVRQTALRRGRGQATFLLRGRWGRTLAISYLAGVDDTVRQVVLLGPDRASPRA